MRQHKASIWKNKDWSLSENALEALRLWNEGMSSGQISIELNRRFHLGVSRNAVVGLFARIEEANNKLDKNDPKRIKISHHPNRGGAGWPKGEPRKPRNAGINNLSPSDWRPRKSLTRRERIEAKKERTLPPIETNEERSAFVPVGIDLIEIKSSECHFPVGPMVTTYCGHPTWGGAYCVHHFRMMYVIKEKAA